MKKDPDAAPLDPAFVEMLACPACEERPPLHLEEGGRRLRCDRCGRAYPISPEGIPLLLPEEAERPLRAEATGPASPGQS